MEYVEQRSGGYFVAGTRVSLDSGVYAFLRGESPEGITESFPALRLEQVYGAITFYLAHRPEIDTYLEQGSAEFKKLRDEARKNHPHAPCQARGCETTVTEPAVKPRFLADADFNHKIIAGLKRRDRRIDFVPAIEGGVIGLPDPAVLEIAAGSGRILVSHD